MAKILCVEDEDALRQDILEELTDAGYDVIEAENGAEGLKAIVEHAPDLVLCDVTMPVMDGHTLLTELRENYPDNAELPFVFLTALADRDDVIAGKKLGADDYLTKPIDFEMLLATVESRLSQIDRINERKEEQMVKLYKALSTATDESPDPETEQPAGTGAATELESLDLQLVVVAGKEIDAEALCKGLKQAGNNVVSLRSGKEFLERQAELNPDLLLVSFNTDDMQAPMIAAMLKDKSYPKVLLLPPSMSNMTQTDSVPGFDAVVRWSEDAAALDEMLGEVSANFVASKRFADSSSI